MAVNETRIVHDCMKAISEAGARCFKNVRGLFLTLDGQTKISGGLLCPGASDLIGWYSTIITPDMVGKRIAVFTAFEVKTATGKVSQEQANFITQVKENGGIAGILRDKSEVKLFLK